MLGHTLAQHCNCEWRN